MHKPEYDVIIIGAGISGLVCGCYLAKAGLKTLIIEKNAKPGGYCTSFIRKGFFFDACVHALSSVRPGAVLAKTLDDLGITDTLKLYRYDPSDIVMTPEYSIKIYTELSLTVDEFSRYFPGQRKQIHEFFSYIATAPITTLLQLRRLTFAELLDRSFSDEYLKTIIGTYVFGLVGTFPRELSALVGCLIYREFVFDGGYYPAGGIQEFPNHLVRCFKRNNGDMVSLKEVTEIKTEGDRVSGIVLDNNFIATKMLIAACDLNQPIFSRLGAPLTDMLKHNAASFIPSLSAFILYIGLQNIPLPDTVQSNIWIINGTDMRSIEKNLRDFKNDFLVLCCPSAKTHGEIKPGENSICISTLAPYKEIEFWNDSFTRSFSDRLIRMTEQIIPGLSRSIALQLIATPHILYKWTYNSYGAAYGWASTPEQFGNPDISHRTPIKNLFQTGHWTNLSSGVSSVVNCGKNTADLAKTIFKL